MRELWLFKLNGTFQRQTAPFTVQRYLCLSCRRSFSTQTFRPTYWLKRPELLPKIFMMTVGGMANRQIARALGCAPGTIDTMLQRLGRHSLLYQRHLLHGASPCVDIVVDGLMTFEFSQFFPFELLVGVGFNDSFIEYFTDAPRRRSGAMTSRQQARRRELEAKLGRPEPQAVLDGMRELFRVSLRGADRAVVHSDKHKAYPRALRGIACEVEHRQTDSRAKRDRRNEMFEINALDSFIRHSCANHRRETIAQSKRRQDGCYRFGVFALWKNCVKRRWENGGRVTAAMLRGVTDRVLTVEDILDRRLFPSLITLPPRWDDYYWRRIVTPVLGVNRRHELKYAR
jgi:transposase-like protein